MLLIPQAQLHAQLQIADVQSLQRRDRAFKVRQLDESMRKRNSVSLLRMRERSLSLRMSLITVLNMDRSNSRGSLLMTMVGHTVRCLQHCAASSRMRLCFRCSYKHPMDSTTLAQIVIGMLDDEGGASLNITVREDCLKIPCCCVGL